jgi:DNA-binding GntR family transcriptional regulator
MGEVFHQWELALAESLKPSEAENGSPLGVPSAQTDQGSRRQLPEEVAAYARELILSGRVKTGQFLRLEPIAEALGVSNTPVREGLLSLASEGLVALVPRRGFMVGSFTRQDVEDMFWAQATIGSELAGRAATKISKQDLRRLHEIHELWRKARDDGEVENVAKLGHDFHRVINLAADSPRLAALMGQVAAYLPNRFYASLEGQLQSVVHAHPAILEALERGNVRSVRAQMRDHILSGADSLIAELVAQGIWNDEGEAVS